LERNADSSAGIWIRSITSVNAAIGKSVFQDPSLTALATSSPDRPTYMGFRLTEFAPEVTRTEANAGLNGSSVVP
jgi:hypothetical protein